MCGWPRPAAGRMRTPAQMTVRGLALLLTGVVIIFLAGLVTLMTYTLATSSPGGGIYVVLMGPIVLGGFMVVRGADLLVRHSSRFRPPV